MGAWAGAGYGGWGLVAGLQVGQACGVLLLPGLGTVAPAPRFLGTQPPYATQASKSMKGCKCWNCLAMPHVRNWFIQL